MPYKEKEKRKEYHRKYMEGWRKKNPKRWKEILKKSEASPKRKEYLRKWWRESPKAKEITRRFKESGKGKGYHREWDKKNPEKVKLKMEKYSKTPKGILNQIKKVQNRRIKFKKIAGVYYNVPNKNLIKIVDGRDKVCVYCGSAFVNDKKSNKYRSYDHLDAFKPHSIHNTVKCCISCNSSKGDKDVWDWLKLKGFSPAKIIYELGT